MSTSWERTVRADILKDCLATVAGKASRLKTETGRKLSLEAGVLANQLLDPEYDNDEALNRVEAELKCYRAEYEILRQEKENKKKAANPTED